MNTEFKSLVGYEEIEANSDGQLRHVNHHWKAINIYENSIGGYCTAHWHRGPDDKRNISMFKLMASLFVDNPNNYTIIKANDGDNSNYKASNLQWIANKTEIVTCTICNCNTSKTNLLKHQQSKRCKSALTI